MPTLTMNTIPATTPTAKITTPAIMITVPMGNPLCFLPAATDFTGLGLVPRFDRTDRFCGLLSTHVRDMLPGTNRGEHQFSLGVTTEVVAKRLGLALILAMRGPARSAW